MATLKKQEQAEVKVNPKWSEVGGYAKEEAALQDVFMRKEARGDPGIRPSGPREEPPPITLSDMPGNAERLHRHK